MHRAYAARDDINPIALLDEGSLTNGTTEISQQPRMPTCYWSLIDAPASVCESKRLNSEFGAIEVAPR